MRKQLVTGLLALTLAAGLCSAEDPKEPENFFKLEFVVKEVVGSKILNSRTYTAIVATGKQGAEIRAGSKIPYSSSVGQYQLVDVGVNIDVRSLKEVGERLSFNITAEISSVAETSADQTRPTIRQNKWISDLIVPLKKPAILFSSENVDAKSQMQVEVTATPIP